MDQLVKDVRFGLRVLGKSPTFTTVAIATLALAIGANTALFGVFDAVILRAVPYPHPGRLVQLWSSYGGSNGPGSPLSRPDLRDIAGQNAVFARLGYYRLGMGMTLTGLGSAERLTDVRISPGLFDVLGTRPLLGRGFLPEESERGRDRVVILSYAFWKRNLGSMRRPIGQTIRLDNRPYEVVGIMPTGFGFPSEFTSVWLPVSQSSARSKLRGLRDTYAIARLRGGITLRNAQADLSLIARRLAHELPEDDGLRFELVSLQDQAAGPVRPTVLLLMGAVGLVLLIACANVASLMLVRAAGREREMGVRVALGATRWRIVRQLLSESLLLGLLGGSAGLGLAFWGIHAIRALAPVPFPRLDQASINTGVLCFTFAISVGAGLVFGLAPAMRISKQDLTGSLREGTLTSRGGFALRRGHRLHSLLVALQIALALILLIGAGLMLRSLRELMKVPLGFDPHELLTVRLSEAALVHMGEAGTDLYYRNLVERVRSLPGVIAASLASTLPLGARSLLVPIRPGQGTREEMVQLQVVSPEYFTVMRIPIRHGRPFNERDVSGSPLAVVVNSAAARRIWPGQNPVGRRVKIGGRVGPTGEVVGVAGDARDVDLAEPPRPEVYCSRLQFADSEDGLIVRTVRNPLLVANSVADRIWSLNKDERITDVATMDDLVSRRLGGPRLRTLPAAIFAGLALILAAVGVYGVVADSASQRLHEFGIRIALGAEPGDILVLAIRRALAVTLAGSVAGLAASFALTRLLAGLLYRVRPTDAITFGLATLTLAFVSVIAGYIPARRAAKADPVLTLRYE